MALARGPPHSTGVRVLRERGHPSRGQEDVRYGNSSLDTATGYHVDARCIRAGHDRYQFRGPNLRP